MKLSQQGEVNVLNAKLPLCCPRVDRDASVGSKAATHNCITICTLYGT